MNILKGFAILGMCVAVLTSGCSDDTVAQPGNTTNTSAAAPSSPPTTGPTAPATSAPASPPTVPKTPKQSAKPSKKPPAKTTPPPTVRPIKPAGDIIPVEALKPNSGKYPLEVRTAKDGTLVCRSGNLDPVVLKRNGTVMTDIITKDQVSTLTIKRGLLVFPQKGSVLPSDTLIADGKLFGFVPKEMLKAKTSGTGSLLLRSGTQDGGWGDITNPNVELKVCHSRSKYR